MKAARSNSSCGRLALLFVFAFASELTSHAAEVEEGADLEASLEADQAEAPPRSLLDESYAYHRFGELPEEAPHPTAARAGGWYRYGFPVHGHRWGWFGAEHYYPRVLWHRGYYGDRCRWSYRRGY
ncbi:MAG TPA: hypothetical protein VGK58_00585 [Lacipirellulaceae bacterium]